MYGGEFNHWYIVCIYIHFVQLHAYMYIPLLQGVLHAIIEGFHCCLCVGVGVHVYTYVLISYNVAAVCVCCWAVGSGLALKVRHDHT